jgi:hypothetical protein
MITKSFSSSVAVAPELSFRSASETDCADVLAKENVFEPTNVGAVPLDPPLPNR